MADWNAIRQEYITDESSSYRKLAQKYGVSLGAITRHSQAEGWQDLREQVKNETITKSVEKISEERRTESCLPRIQEALKTGYSVIKLCKKRTVLMIKVHSQYGCITKGK